MALQAVDQAFASNQKSQADSLQTLGSRDYKNMNDKKMKDVSKDFESIFITQLFKSMRSTIPKDAWLDGGMKQEVFEDMLYEQYAKNMANQGGIGLGDTVYRYLQSTKAQA